MIDTHCHLDLYPNPTQAAESAKAAGIGIISVTNLPSAFERAYPFIGEVKGIRLALGLHPLLAREHSDQLGRFSKLVDKTSYIGEVGLDFSFEGRDTRELQEASFRFVLRAVRGRPRFITVHSRRAEAQVLQLLDEEQHLDPIVFHWYSGSITNLRDALLKGHYFSINPAMIESTAGQRIIDCLPRDRVLTETDGPFVQVQQRSAQPQDVALVHSYLRSRWQVTDVERQVKGNFTRLSSSLGGLGATKIGL